MINEILSCVENMKAIDRFIFLGLLYQKKPIIDGNRKELARNYGFSEGVVDRTLNGLAEAGFLEKVVNEKNSEKPGRPTYKYKNVIAEKLIHKLKLDLNINKVFANKHIQSLFIDDLHPIAHIELKADTKLLLIVLLNNADKFGFVQGLENSVLLKLTGMKPQALIGQIQKLISLGYIRSKISGINGRYLFGRMSSAYILNLQHNNFSSFSEKTRKFLYFKHPDSLLYKSAHKLIGKQRFINFAAPGTFESQKLIVLSQGILDLSINKRLTENQKRADWEARTQYTEIMKLTDYDQFNQIALFFITNSNPEIFASFLQFKLNQYASELISKNFLSPDINNKNIKEKIRNEIFHPKLERAIKNEETYKELLFTEENKLHAIQLIYSISLLIARDTSRILSSRNLPGCIVMNQPNLRILPALKDDYRYLAVDSDHKVNDEQNYFVYGDTIVKKSEVEGNLVAEDVLMEIDGESGYETFSYGNDEEISIARKLLQTIESRFLYSLENMPDEQLYCFSLHQFESMKYSNENGWLSAPKKASELQQ